MTAAIPASDAAAGPGPMPADAPVSPTSPAAPGPVPATGRKGRSPVVTFLISPVDPATWRAVISLIVGVFVIGIAASIVFTLFSMGGSLLIFLVGFAFVALGIEGARITATVERWRMSLTDQRELLAHPYKAADPRPQEPYGPWLKNLAEAEFLDVSRWLDVAYLLIAIPLITFEALVAFTLWMTSIGLMAGSVIWALTPWNTIDAGGRYWAERFLQQAQQVPEAWLVVAFVVGLVLLPVAAMATRGIAVLHRAVVEGLLCISPAEALRRDNERLRGSRSAALELEASELRRIERDIHDGAQQRLVMLAIDLTLAEDKVDTDPAAAKTLIAGARDQARQALGELRDVVRGAAPAILLDRGLAPALSAIAGRSAVPTFVDSRLAPGERLPHAVERAAYYLVSEALTNVAKHSHANRCDVLLWRVPGWLVVEVRDDGTGGAALVQGGGLAGLKDRAEALDGRFEVISPAGGPTTVRVQLPVPDQAPTA